MANLRNTTKSKMISFLKWMVFYFLILFLLLYYFFPVGILKNYIKSEFRLFAIQNQLPLSMDMESVKPYWFSGLELKNLILYNVYEDENNLESLVIKNATGRLSLLPFLIGQFSLDATIKLEDGSSDISFSVPLFSRNMKKFRVSMEFDNFQIQDFVQQYLKALEYSDNPNLALLTPLLNHTSVSGFLNGSVDLRHSAYPGDGLIDLKIEHLVLSITDPVLNLPVQHFKNAALSISWDGKTYTVSPKTKFESENLYFQSNGTIQVFEATPSVPSFLNLDLLMVLSGEMEKNFGFLVPQLLKCPSTSMVSGVMNVKLVGPTTQYTCQ